MAFATRLATIHSYKEDSLAEPESRTSNRMTQLQPLQFHRIQSAALLTRIRFVDDLREKAIRVISLNCMKISETLLDCRSHNISPI